MPDVIAMRHDMFRLGRFVWSRSHLTVEGTGRTCCGVRILLKSGIGVWHHLDSTIPVTCRRCRKMQEREWAR